jgi:hypothetical protein
MAESESSVIKHLYTQLLELVRKESEINTSVLDYYSYLEQYKDRFSEESNLLHKEGLREFLRAANRYSDEFVFSDKHYDMIKQTTNRLFDILNTDNPIS